MHGSTARLAEHGAPPVASLPPRPWFRSDNVSGVCPEILAALVAANAGSAQAYGADAVSAQLDGLFGALFECEVVVLPVLTGTAANALALAGVPPRTNVLCHADAHILLDEAGAIEFYGDIRLTGIAGTNGKLSAEGIEGALSGRRSSGTLRTSAVSIAQATELGTVYAPGEVAAIADVAHRNGMMLHLDGARFANAVAALGCSPADASWRAGVDMLSFGATKNGALAAEAVVFFDQARVGDIATRRKRAGHTLSKMRFLSAQLAAYIEDGLWLRNAAQANGRAADLARALAGIAGATLVTPVETNQVFAALPDDAFTALLHAGIDIHRWGPPGSSVTRLVTAFDTGAEEIEEFARALAACTHERGTRT
jgi:threonine aldolase